MLKNALRRDEAPEILALDIVFVTPPTLDGLVVRVPPVRDLDEETLVTMWGNFVRDGSPRTARDVVAAGNEVRLLVVGYENELLVPFTARTGFELVAGDDPLLPELSAALVGHHAGERFVAEGITLPDDYPQRALAGRTLDFIVEIEGILEVHPVHPGDPDAIQKIGYAETVETETILRGLGEGWMEAQLTELTDTAEEQMFDEWLARSEFSSIPDEAVEHELWIRWKTSEAKTLLAVNAGESELARSWAAWSADEKLYAESMRAVRLTLLFRAIAEQDGLEATVEDGLAALSILAPEIGVDAEELKQILRDRPEIGQRALHLGFMKRLRKHILDQVPVEDPNAGEYSLPD